MLYSGDPVRDADRYTSRQERRYAEYLRNCPECEICGEPIEDEYAYDIGNEEYIHEDCVWKLRKRLY